jgi:hypothetical protein
MVRCEAYDPETSSEAFDLVTWNDTVRVRGLEMPSVPFDLVTWNDTVRVRDLEMPSMVVDGLGKTVVFVDGLERTGKRHEFWTDLGELVG